MKFDCKTAVVTMKGDATIAEAAASKALVDAGFGMKEFSGGPAATDVVVRALVKTKEGAAPAAASATALATELPRELPALAELFVEPDGRVTARVKSDAKLDAAELSAALARRGLVASGVESRAWPRTAAGYHATIARAGAATTAAPSAALSAAERAKARGAIETIDNVLAAIDAADGGFLVFTKEPCTNLEARLRAALQGAALDLARLGTR